LGATINRLLGIGERQTVGAVLDRHRGIGPGFDLLRIALAYYIFYGHALWLAGASDGVAAAANAPILAGVAGGGTVFAGWTRPFHVAVVPMFFALSGFLVMGSAFRLKRTSTFLAFRFMRIFPALIVEVTLCALMLGPALTSFSLPAYFSDPTLYRYFGNMVGWITFKLPGLFLGNPVSGTVNANLWTLPAEFDCYLITALLMATSVLYNRRLFTIALAVVTAVLIPLNIFTDFAVTPGILPAFAITYYFLVGALFYMWRDRLPAHWLLFVASAAIGYLLLMNRHTVFIAPMFLTYVIVFFGLVRVPKLPLIGTGDYSYGIYLYGFPIAQALVAVAPGMFVGHRYRLLACATLCACAFAAFSWHVIEKRALALKRHLPERWFPTPKRIPRQSPEGRAEQANVVPARP